MLLGGLFLGLAPDRADEPQPQPQPRPQQSAPRFFVLRTNASVPSGQVPLELILSQLEQHVRQERAVVAFFHEQPSPESLRSQTSSPLAN